jgi:hypothetical protein
MMLENLVKKNSFVNLLLLFILIQPILDLATSLAITYFNSQFTAGILIRFGMMALGFGYLVFITDSKKKSTAIMYLIILGLIILLGFTNNMMVKSPIILSEEIKFLTKSIYFVIIFFSYLFVFREMQKQISWGDKIQKYIVYAMIIVGLSMVISDLTNTAFNSYTYNKVGHSGWFYAGNELSAIMSICFPIVVLYAIKKTTSIKNAYYWIPALLLIYSLMAVGTKVGFGAVLITILISMVMQVIDLFTKRKTKNPSQKINIMINIVVFLLFLGYVPFSPIAENTSIHLTLLKTQEQEKQPSKTPSKKEEKKHTEQKKEKENLSNKQVENLVLSGRGAYLEQQRQYFAEAPASQKILGMGYAGNYKEYPKMIEMDFYDLFFSFGILGFIVYFAPFIRMGFEITIKIIRNIKSQFTLENVLILSGIILGLGIAFTAGHVFTAPAVSIYLAILVAYLYLKVVYPSKDNE